MIKDPRENTLDHLDISLNYLDIIKRIDAIFIKIRRNHSIAGDCMSGIFDKLYRNYKKFIKFVISAKVHGREQAKHAVDSAILAVAIAERMNLSMSWIKIIIEAALLHDVGMLSVPRDILDKTDSLSKNEYRYILIHPLQSFKFISRELYCFEGVSQIALQHHEYWNGKGYPKRLPGTSIILAARILAVADVFVALISERPYRHPLNGHQAMSNLISNTQAQFDPAVLKAFVQVMGIYPVGSLVELNNGTTAQIVEYTRNAPMLKPRVQLLTNSGGKFIKQENTLDLLQEKGLFIKNALNEQNVLLWNMDGNDEVRNTGIG